MCCDRTKVETISPSAAWSKRSKNEHARMLSNRRSPNPPVADASEEVANQGGPAGRREGTGYSDSTHGEGKVDHDSGVFATVGGMVERSLMEVESGLSYHKMLKQGIIRPKDGELPVINLETGLYSCLYSCCRGPDLLSSRASQHSSCACSCLHREYAFRRSLHVNGPHQCHGFVIVHPSLLMMRSAYRFAFRCTQEISRHALPLQQSPYCWHRSHGGEHVQQPSNLPPQARHESSPQHGHEFNGIQ